MLFTCFFIFQVQYKPNKPDCTLNNMHYMPLRASLSAISNREDMTMEYSKPVRSFLSDRALNKLKIPQTLRETIFDDVEDSPIPLRNLLPSVLEKHLRSEPKLFSTVHSQDNLQFSNCPSRSLNQVSNLRDSFSDFSKNTSGTSDFTTAPLNDSTSFSTPPEDMISSSNNGQDSNKSAYKSSENNTTSNYLTCDEDSFQESREISQGQDNDAKDCIHSVFNSPENSTYCEFSSNKSDTNALTGSSNSMSAATVSDLSTDINEESKHESSNAAISGDDSPTRCSCSKHESTAISVDDSPTRCSISKHESSSAAISVDDSPTRCSFSKHESSSAAISIDDSPTRCPSSKHESGSAAISFDDSHTLCSSSKHESSSAAVSVEDSPKRCFSSSTTVKNKIQEHPKNIPDTEIRNININIGENRSSISEVQPSKYTDVNFVERTTETTSKEISAKCITLDVNTDNSAQSSNNADSNENKTVTSQDNNNVTEEPTRDVQIDHLRNQIFRLERELILLQLDQSDAVDL